MRFIGKLFKILFFLLFAFLLIGVGYYIAVTKDTRLDDKKLILNEKSIVLYDKNLNVVKNTASFSPKQTVLISEIPTWTKKAFVDTEDKRFFKHNGFDYKRIVKAALGNVKAGAYKQGASTISQQLIKNTHLTQEKTLKRKLREWKLTKRLEKRYSKDEILEKYLNTIYFGHSCFGLKAAADFYFGKTPQDLTLADSAILAGLVKSPNNYSPFKNPQKCNRRKEIVLRLMVNNHSITKAQKDAAMQEPLPLSPKNGQGNKGYIQFVFDELASISESNGFPVGGNMKIYTDLDPVAQADLEKLCESYTESNLTALILDTKTGGYKACVSDVENIQRLPGSLIKPLLVYAPALEENLLSPATPILDEPVDYNGYKPENYNDVYHGYVSARECVEKSLNVPAVKILSSLGIKKGVSYLEKLNLPVEKQDESLALALGGMSRGFTLKQLLSAYHAFPNGGTRTPCGFIQKIQINDVVVYQRKTTQEKVFSKESAYLMTDVLKSTAKNGTAKKLRSLPFDVAAKTGTVGTKKGNTDAYALSYTTKDCIGVWMGNHDNTKIQQTGGGAPCNLLFKINEALYNQYTQNNERIENFEKPSNVLRVALDKNAYYDTHTMLLADKAAPPAFQIEELFKKDALPTRQSQAFSKPIIPAPSIEFTGKEVKIHLDKNSPKFYQYKIEKYDYVTHNTVYLGEYKEVFIDAAIMSDRHYIYTVTPLFGNVQGASIELPAISTQKKASIPKDWWKD